MPITTIPVPLPENPLRELNAYLITGGERNLLIDTGFNRPECLKAIQSGLDRASVGMENTDIFLTHLHADHTGLAPTLAAGGTEVFISGADLARMQRAETGVSWEESNQVFIREGFAAEQLEELVEKNPARRFAPPPFDRYTAIDSGVLRYGGLELELVPTPGHTPGHQCLYDRERQLMFLGDHVLFDITPNITTWHGFPNALKQYLRSLEMIEDFAVSRPLPAHRSVGEVSMKERIAALKEHHRLRLEEALSVIARAPGLGAYDIAGQMTWRIRCNSWEDFPLAQKWFAVGETMAHIDYLVEEGRVKKELVSGRNCYY